MNTKLSESMHLRGYIALSEASRISGLSLRQLRSCRFLETLRTTGAIWVSARSLLVYLGPREAQRLGAEARLKHILPNDFSYLPNRSQSDENQGS